MATHWLGQVTPWRAIAQIVHRDALAWSRELQVQAAHRLLGLSEKALLASHPAR